MHTTIIGRRLTALAGLGTALALSACYGEQGYGSGDSTPEGDSTIATFALREDLPACNEGRLGEVYYVSSEDQLYYCDGQQHRAIEVTGEPGADGASGPQGEPGAPGAEGPQGAAGPQGEQGAPGEDGEDGTDGTDGQTTLILTEAAPVGACPNGGIAVLVGLDTSGDGVLDPDEVTDTSYVCNGVDGIGGEPVNLTRETPEPRGVSCIDGGIRVDWGTDDNRNGRLEADEIDNTTYECIPCGAGNHWRFQPNLQGCELSGVTLGPVNWPNVNLSDANLSGAGLGPANLTNANLTNANLSNANLNHATLTDANLSNANLNGANLNGAILLNAILSGANLSNAVLISAFLNGANLSNAKLNGANLDGANLTEADLSNADLSGATVWSANLFRTNLRGANLLGLQGLSQQPIWQFTDATTICPQGNFGPCL